MSRKKNTRTNTKKQQEVKIKAPRSSLSFSHKWIISFILVVTFLAFANTLHHGFAYDDTTQILQNEVIRSFSNLPTAFTKEVWFWRVLQDKDPNKESGPTTPYYRPMFTVYLMMGWFLFDTYAPGWHLINLLMHLLAVYFAFLVLHRITKDTQLTAIATLLFALASSTHRVGSVDKRSDRPVFGPVHFAVILSLHDLPREEQDTLPDWHRYFYSSLRHLQRSLQSLCLFSSLPTRFSSFIRGKASSSD